MALSRISQNRHSNFYDPFSDDQSKQKRLSLLILNIVRTRTLPYTNKTNMNIAIAPEPRRCDPPLKPARVGSLRRAYPHRTESIITTSSGSTAVALPGLHALRNNINDLSIPISPDLRNDSSTEPAIIDSESAAYSSIFAFYDPLKSLRHLPYTPIYTPPLSFEARHTSHKPNMNKSGPLKVSIMPCPKVTFAAGGDVWGTATLKMKPPTYLGSSKKTNSLTVGEIGVELIGFEELFVRGIHDVPLSFTFIQSRQIFQHPAKGDGTEHVTSALRHPYPPPDSAGFREPVAGKTVFPWSFKLPSDLPSSGLSPNEKCRIRYVLSAYAKIRENGVEKTIENSANVEIVEAWDIDNPSYYENQTASRTATFSASSSSSSHTSSTEEGEVKMILETRQNLFKAGDYITCGLRIQNNSPRSIPRVKCALMRRTTIFQDRRPKNDHKNLAPIDALNRQLSLNLTDKDKFFEDIVAIKTWETDCDANDCQVYFPLKIGVPEDIRTLRNTALFSVDLFLRVYIPGTTIEFDVSNVHVAHENSTIEEAPVTHFDTEEKKTFYSILRIEDGHISISEHSPEIVPQEPDFYVDAWNRVTLLDPSMEMI
ncbi:hypothetical protein CANCADRAFT_58238 [Tortispora caseinolytica NRRL Y-17796]|uniref:Arrestin C-terminal-like domain-containing protein n=1 Tax=Tortispora caseinolytica NRRL Y-17796 TaxID=767744 RepID=A0A1E4TBX4_9ASCO|nr:hypothetical protein CANCADRAFT_58238 [Tortispora caseinolytica NRRL Y-17796]